MFKNRKRKGFTLIELVIVIAIIGILVAIAVPRFADATQGARNRRIDATARTIAGGMSQYYASKLTWPVSTTPAEKTAVLDAAGVPTSEQGYWSFKHVDATSTTKEYVEIEYSWSGGGDAYTGEITGITTVDTTGKKVTYKF